MRESGPTLVVALCVDAALRLLAGVELAAGVRVAVVVQPARANLQTKSPRVMDELNQFIQTGKSHRSVAPGGALGVLSAGVGAARVARLHARGDPVAPQAVPQHANRRPRWREWARSGPAQVSRGQILRKTTLGARTFVQGEAGLRRAGCR